MDKDLKESWAALFKRVSTVKIDDTGNVIITLNKPNKSLISAWDKLTTLDLMDILHCFGGGKIRSVIFI